MSTLNLFPARVPIGYADSNGQVLMTPEFFRALTDLLQRVGGTTAPDTEDLDITASISQAPVIDFSPFMDAALGQQGVDAAAAVAEARKAIEDINVQIAQAVAQLAEVKKQAESLEVMAGYTDPFRVNWERPGTIGSLTASSARFTALTTDGTVNVNLGTDTTNSSVNLRGSNAGAGGGTAMSIRNNNVAILNFGNKSAVNGGAYDATPYIFGNAQIEFGQGIKVPGGAQFLQTSTALTNGAGAGAGTITNAPAAGNPTKWVAINDNGTLRYIPAW
jgi:hypothetical protein